MEAILALPGEGLLLSLHGSGGSEGHGTRAGERLRFLAAELPAPSGRRVRSPLREVIRAAGA
ncbi:MAG: hypothetical protein ACRDJF_03415, partial [Actinomycetota bacterium]